MGSKHDYLQAKKFVYCGSTFTFSVPNMSSKHNSR